MNNNICSKIIVKRYIARIKKADTLAKLTRVMCNLEYCAGMKADDWDFVRDEVLKKREKLWRKK